MRQIQNNMSVSYNVSNSLLGLYVFTIPFLSYLPGYNYISWLAGVAFIISYISVSKKKYSINLVSYTLIVWLIWTLIVSLYIGEKIIIKRVRSIVLNIAMITFIISYVRLKNKKLYILLLKYWICGAALALVPHAHEIVKDPTIIMYERPDLGYDQATFASFIYSITALLTLHIYKIKKNNNLLYLLLTFIFVAGSVSTGSRQGVIAFFFGAIVYSFLISESKRRFVSSLLAVLLFFAFTFYYFDYDLAILRRFERLYLTLTGQYNEGSTNLRIDLILSGIEMFKDKPLQGHGIGMYRYMALEYGVSKSTYSHNNFIEILSSTGIVGFFLYYTPFVATMVGIFYSSAEWKTKSFVCSLVVSLMVADMFRVSYYQRADMTLFAIAAGQLRIFAPTIKRAVGAN